MYTSFFKRERRYDPFRAKEIINLGILLQETSHICMYTSFFKRERQYDPFRAKEIIHLGILSQETSHICMYTSFFKRQYEATDTATTNRPHVRACVSDNMIRRN